MMKKMIDRILDNLLTQIIVIIVVVWDKMEIQTEIQIFKRLKLIHQETVVKIVRKWKFWGNCKIILSKRTIIQITVSSQ